MLSRNGTYCIKVMAPDGKEIELRILREGAFYSYLPSLM